MSDKEKELLAREEALRAKEREIEAREKALANKPFSRALQARKELWYDRAGVSVRQMDIIIGVTCALLAIVILLIILEATGVYTLKFG